MIGALQEMRRSNEIAVDTDLATCTDDDAIDAIDRFMHANRKLQEAAVEVGQAQVAQGG